MPWEVRVFQVVPGQPEFLGAPTLNTVLRKPGLQLPLLAASVPDGPGGTDVVFVDKGAERIVVNVQAANDKENTRLGDIVVK